MFCPYCGAQLNEGAVFCSGCGKKVGEAAPPAAEPLQPTYEPLQTAPAQSAAGFSTQANTSAPFDEQLRELTAVKPIKRRRISPLAVILPVVGVILIGGIAAYFITLNNGYLYKSGGVKLIHDITHLCVQHHYIDADCENPDICEICGDERGEPLGHDWIDATCAAPKACSVCGKTEGEPLAHSFTEATCTEPKVCSVCGEEEGEPLGHTTGLGVCSRCGEKVTDLQDVFYEIAEISDDGTNYFSIGCGYLSSCTTVLDFYIHSGSAVTYFALAQSKYLEAVEKCGDYEEFAEIKKYLQEMADYIPTEAPSNTTSSVTQFIYDINDTSEAGINFTNAYLDIGNEIQN